MERERRDIRHIFILPAEINALVKWEWFNSIICEYQSIKLDGFPVHANLLVCERHMYRSSSID